MFTFILKYFFEPAFWDDKDYLYDTHDSVISTCCIVFLFDHIEYGGYKHLVQIVWII